MKTSITALTLALSLAGLTQLSYAQVPDKTAEQKAPAAVTIPDPVATIDGKPVAKADYEKFIKFMASQGQPVPTDPAQIKAIIEDYALQNVLAADAKKAGLDQTDEFKIQKEMIELGLLAQKEVMSKIDAIKISDADIKAEYDKQVASINGQEYNASHILVETEDAAKALIEKINKGLKFEEAAKESKDPGSAAQGGSLGWFTAETMVPEFSNAVKEMKKGEVTQKPVKSQFGYHIIRLDDSREVVKPTLAELKSQIESTLKNTKARDLVEQIRKDAKIEVLVK